MSRFVLLSTAFHATALQNGLARTPPMGFNTWNVFRCGGVSGAAIVEVADNLTRLGLARLGYTYVNIDDCWSTGSLDADGALVAEPGAFPGGITAVAEEVHARGLKLGIYSDRGFRTCAGYPGSGGHEALHARQLAAWGVDYLKYDSCYASNAHETAFQQYGAMRDALNATGRPVLFSLCGWNAWYAPLGDDLGHTWRIAPDVDEWANVYVATRTNEELGRWARPGAFNDPDMLVGSDPKAAVHLTPEQSQTQFSLWAVMAAPLLLGSPLGSMPASDLATYSNEEVIAVNQDRLGTQGWVVWQNCPPFEPRDNWWMSPWSMPHDVAMMWTKAMLSLLVLLAALGAACSRSTACGGGGGGGGKAPQTLRRSARLLGSPSGASPPAPRRAPPREGGVRGAARRCLSGAAAALALAALCVILAIWAHRPRVEPCQQAWARPLLEGDFAVCLVNFAPRAARFGCDEACAARLLDDGDDHHVTPRHAKRRVAHAFKLRDLVAKEDLAGEHYAIEAEVAGDGGSRLYRVTPGGAQDAAW